MTECIFIAEARYIEGFRVFLRFNTGEAGEVDLRNLVHEYETAGPLRDPIRFSQFHLDSWPTLAWDCGFDIAPESLYFRVTGKEMF
uniref:DUF2442 domain-containing protein n=1 Tax=Candidatus Kentrum sp. SD TaxID=2126332 RepID=A0A450Y7L1_9GAMM|nr:MAG: Protein of unknown function (DUF2442) [Candidatus Kentron sp. SD]VFK43345.1 MAG: Protein of unknown function (DUF2442) [Candidatus Kentron sp. SD]